jgi:DNA-directed RNA polymerase specialized sigma24 family protein
MAAMSYTVRVTREDGYWLAELPELEFGGHTDARSLATLDRYVREIIVLAEDLPDEAMETLELVYEYHTGDDNVDREVDRLRRERREVERRRTELTKDTERAVLDLRRRGYSDRDIAQMTGVSFQRVAAILRQAA